MNRRQLTLLLLLILGVALWLTRAWWLSPLLAQIPALEKRADLIQTIDSMFSIVALVVNLGMGYLLWLTHQQQEERRHDELTPLKATSWQTIRERSPQGARIPWIDRGATDANDLRAQPRLALIGLSGEGKTREAAELIRRAVELELVVESQVFEPNRDFLHTGAAITSSVLDKVVEPTQRAALFIDDLHSYSATTLTQLATLLALFTHPQLDHRYVIATVRSDLVSPEQSAWLTQQGFQSVRLPQIDDKQAEQWLTSAGQLHSLTLSKKVRKTFIMQNRHGTPGHLLRGFLTIKSGLNDNAKGRSQIKAEQVAAVMTDLAAQERQALCRREPLATYLLNALAHFHAAGVRTAQPLILAYAATLQHRERSAAGRWLSWRTSRTLQRALVYLTNFDVSVQAGVVVAPDVLIEGADAYTARQAVGEFLVAYRRPLHNRLLRRFHRHAEAQRWALFDLAMGYGQGQEHTAAHFYTAAIRVAPHYGFYVNRGLARRVQGDLSAAIADFDQAIALNPQDATTYNNRGNARAAQGDLSAAIADFDQAIALNPRSKDKATVYNNRGNACIAQSDLPVAIANYNQAIALNPQYGDAYYNRGITYATQGDMSAAIADYDQAIALNPHDAAAYHNRGVARHAQGKADEAIDDYDQAIALFPDGKDKAAAYNNRGNTRKVLGDLPAAIADYDQAIALDPQDAAAYNNRGTARHGQGDLPAAIADYDQAIALDPQYTAAYYNRGLTRQIQGKWAEAIASYRQSLTLDSSQFWAWVGLANAARQLGDEPTYKEAIAQARSRLPEGDAYNLACIESVAGNVEEALAALTQAAQADDFDPAHARQDPDLAWVRADPRFAEIVDNVINRKAIDVSELDKAEEAEQATVSGRESVSRI